MEERLNNKTRLLKYLREVKEGITQAEAYQELGNTRLSGTVFVLRKEGYNIVSQVEKGKNRFGESRTWVRYKLIDSAED